MNALVLAVLAAASSAGPRVHLEVERGPKAVVLIAREAQRNEVRGLRRVEAKAACTAPCDAVVDPGAPGFFVAGRDVLPSSTFHLPPTGDVTVRVRAGRRSAFLTGWTLAGAGTPALLAGATLMTLADDDADRLRVGAAVAGVGVVMVVTGAILIATGRTKVRFESAVPGLLVGVLLGGSRPQSARAITHERIVHPHSLVAPASTRPGRAPQLRL